MEQTYKLGDKIKTYHHKEYNHPCVLSKCIHDDDNSCLVDAIFLTYSTNGQAALISEEADGFCTVAEIKDHLLLLRNYNIEFSAPLLEKYQNNKIWGVPLYSIIGVTEPVVVNSGGEYCISCGEYYHMAVRNHKDGLVCYSCRSCYGWKYNGGLLK